MTKPNLAEEHKTGTFVMSRPTGKVRWLGKFVQVAQWATAHAIGSKSAEWLCIGEQIEAGSVMGHIGESVARLVKIWVAICSPDLASAPTVRAPR